MKYNYHTHCNVTDHATGSIEDYILKAIEMNYQVIGFSEHMPSPFSPTYRISMEDYYLRYLNELKRCKQLYGDKITILAGLEVEYEPHFKAFHNMLLNQLDYLILGEHQFMLNGISVHAYGYVNEAFLKQYSSYISEALKSKKYQILAHPDVFRMGYGNKFDDLAIKYSKIIIQAAIDNDIFLEINANGVRHREITKDIYYYPCYEFFMLAKEMGAKFIIGDDSHALNEFNDQATLKTEKLVKSLGIELPEMIYIK